MFTPVRLLMSALPMTTTTIGFWPLLCTHQKLTFHQLTFHHSPIIFLSTNWRMLFNSLNRLRERRHIRLSLLKWDYEVMLCNPEGVLHQGTVRFRDRT